MDSSSSSPSGGILSSPRAQRRLLFVSGAVLGVGLIVFFVTYFTGSSGYHSPLSTKSAQHAPKQVKAAPDPAAYKVARKFIETAPLRKNLDVAYPLVNHEIKGSQSLKQWEKGNIAVLPYPAGNTKTAGFEVMWSYKTQLMLVVDLVARKGTDVRPHLPFYLGLVRAGNKPNGRWLVNYWEADWAPPIPTNQ
jgi:hypothetical protein